MVLQIVCIVLEVVLLGFAAVLYRKHTRLRDRLAALSASMRELSKRVDRVDDSTGAEIYKLKKDFHDFKTDYGDAAIEEMKESAKAQKAFADGLGSIMNYGANLYGRGDSK